MRASPSAHEHLEDVNQWRRDVDEKLEHEVHPLLKLAGLHASMTVPVRRGGDLLVGSAERVAVSATRALYDPSDRP